MSDYPDEIGAVVPEHSYAIQGPKLEATGTAMLIDTTRHPKGEGQTQAQYSLVPCLSFEDLVQHLNSIELEAIHIGEGLVIVVDAGGRAKKWFRPNLEATAHVNRFRREEDPPLPALSHPLYGRAAIVSLEDINRWTEKDLSMLPDGAEIEVDRAAKETTNGEQNGK